MLIEPEAVRRALELVAPDDFYRDAHKIIAQAILSVSHKKQPVDEITVAAELRAQGKLEDLGGAAYLCSLVETVPTAAHVVRYARIVQEKARLRRLITVGSKLTEHAYAQDSPDKLLDSLRRTVDEERSRARGIASAPAGKWVSAAYQRFEQFAADYKVTGGVPRGVLFSMTELDHATTGLRPPKFGIILGKTGSGKTALALQGVIRSVIRAKKPEPCLFVSPEMSVEHQLSPRLTAVVAGVPKGDAMFGNLSEDDFRKLAAASEQITKSPLQFCEAMGYTIGDIEREVREAARGDKGKPPVTFVVVDAFQKILGGEGKWQYEQFENIARRLEDMAKELGLVVLVCSQQSFEGQTDTKTKGGRGPEEQADFLIQIIHGREHKLTEEQRLRAHTGYLLVRKDRDLQAQGTIVPYVFDRQRDFYWSELDLAEAMQDRQPNLPSAHEDWEGEEDQPRTRGKVSNHDRF
jgi:replicative DNA helicase